MDFVNKQCWIDENLIDKNGEQGPQRTYAKQQDVEILNPHPHTLSINQIDQMHGIVEECY